MSRTADPTAKIHLLRAAEAVFAEKGISEAKVEEITRRAGTSKGAFYLHFASKDEAFKQVVESFLARITSLLPELNAVPPDLTPMETLAWWRAADEDLYEFLWQNRAILSIVQGCQGEYVYLFEAFLREIHARTMAWLDHWKGTATFRPEIDTELSATLLVGAHNELLRTMLGSPTKPPIAEWVRKAQTMFVRGLGAEPVVRALEQFENPPVSRAIQTRMRAAPPRRRTKASP